MSLAEATRLWIVWTWVVGVVGVRGDELDDGLMDGRSDNDKRR